MGGHGKRRMCSSTRRLAIDGSYLIGPRSRLPGFSADEPATTESLEIHSQRSVRDELSGDIQLTSAEHHQGFNSSIGTFHKIQSSIQASQSRVRSLRESVLNAKSSLMEAKPELHDLGSSSQRYEHMLHILGQM